MNSIRTLDKKKLRTSKVCENDLGKRMQRQNLKNLNVT